MFEYSVFFRTEAADRLAGRAELSAGKKTRRPLHISGHKCNSFVAVAYDLGPRGVLSNGIKSRLLSEEGKTSTFLNT